MRSLAARVTATVPAMVMAMVLGWAGEAPAAPKTLVLGAGECRDGVLLGAVADVQSRPQRFPGVELLSHEDALGQVRPQANRDLDELRRQVEQARSQVYSGEHHRALELMETVFSGLERTPPGTAGLWSTTADALMLAAQIYKSIDRIRDSNEAFRRILRVEPQYQADTNIWPSRTLRALEGVRRDVRRAKRGVLQVAALAPLAGSGASVFVDGREVGKTPLRLELPRGTYRLSVVSGEAVSFPRVVKVDGEVLLQVDLAFEGSVRSPVPLCLTGEDAAALRLAAAVGADRLVVLRSATQPGGPSYLTGVLYEVEDGERVRNAGVRHEQLMDLMQYLFTGEPDISRASPPGLAAAGPPSGSAQAVDVASPTTAFPWRPVGYTALGVGGAAAIAGAIVLAMSPSIRRDASGNVFQEDADQVPVARAHQAAGVGLLAGGAALALAGGAMLLWAPASDSSVVASVVPAPGGGVIVVGGRY